MRATFILAVIAICLTLAHSQVPTVVSVYKFLGYNTNLHEGYNYECMTDKCLGPTPSNYTDETVDNVRSWFCGPTYANITVLMGWNVVWPGLYVYDGTGNPAVSCFSLGVEGDSSLSIYQGGLFFWGTTDFKVANCLLTSTANFEIRSLITFPFNPKTFDTMACPGSVVVKAYTGLEILELKTWSRRVAWRNLRGNITFPANGKTHTWNDYPLESVMELGNWPGFEPVFNIYGNFAKIGGWKTKTILSGSGSTIKMTWHAGSFVRIESPWQIADMKPTSGPNTMSGNVLVNNTNFQIEGRWEITPTANVYGVPGGFNNLTYVGTAAQNTLVLAGSFNSITFFANTTTGNYWTTGTFTNCNAYLTDRATSWTWNRRGADGVATFNSVVLGVNNPNVVLTLRDGAFAFNSLTGPGTYVLSNATLTVAGSTFTTSASLNSFSTLRLTTTASYTLAAPVLGSGTLQFVGGDHYLTSTSSASVSSLNVVEGASLTYPANALSVSVSSGLINRGTTYFGGRNTIANFTRTFSFTQTATGNTVIDFEYSLADGTGRFDALTFAGVMSLNGTLTLNAMATPVVQPDLSWFVPIRTTTLNGLVGGFSSLQHNVNSAVWTIAPCYLSDRVVITVVKTALSTAELWGASSVPLACRPVFVPVSPPVTPVAPPVAAPVNVPVAVPVTPPVSIPVAAPVATPVAVPVAVPVTAPVAAPVDVPVAVPVTPPVAAPVNVPVAAPVTPPVAEPLAAPVDIPVTAPVTPPVAAPIDVPVAVPVNPPVAEAVPVAAPVDVPEPVSVAEPVSEPVTVPVSVPIGIPVAVPVTPPVTEAVPVTPPVTEAVPVTPPVTEAVPPVTEAVPVTPPVTEVVPVTPPVTEAVPVTPPVTEAVPVTPPVTEVVPVTPPVTEVVPVTPPVTEAVPVTPPVTEVVPVTPPVSEPVSAQETSSAPIADAPVESPLAVDAPVARR